MPVPTIIEIYMLSMTKTLVFTVYGGGKKRGITVKILAAPSVRRNADIRAMYGRNGGNKKNVPHVLLYMT